MSPPYAFRAKLSCDCIKDMEECGHLEETHLEIDLAFGP